MATNDSRRDGSSDNVDLDRLIGELETEAARRRAEPGYPHDADARLHFELARMAPTPRRAVPVQEAIAQLEELAAPDTTTAGDPGAGPATRRRHRQAGAGDVERLGARVGSVAAAGAEALRAIADRLDRLEHDDRSAPRHGPEARSDTARPTGPAPAESGALAQWRSRLAESLVDGGRVLYAQTQAPDVVAMLRGAGFDAYGVVGAGTHQPGPDVRSGDLLAHLRAVPDAALDAVVLTGVPEAMTPHDVGPLTTELGRVARCVVIVSESPWWWRLRLGPVEADLAPGRPLHPDTWLHAFHGLSMAGSAEYDADGQSYRVVVRARE